MGVLLFWRCGNLSLIKTPLMEYTRFPQAATRPPRAFSSLGVSLRPFLLQESRIFHSLHLDSVHFPHERLNNLYFMFSTLFNVLSRSFSYKQGTYLHAD